MWTAPKLTYVAKGLSTGGNHHNDVTQFSTLVSPNLEILQLSVMSEAPEGRHMGILPLMLITPNNKLQLWIQENLRSFTRHQSPKCVYGYKIMPGVIVHWERVGPGEVGRVTCRVTCTWLRLGGPILALATWTGLENHSLINTSSK